MITPGGPQRTSSKSRIRGFAKKWGTAAVFSGYAPSKKGDARFEVWSAQYTRNSSSLGIILAQREALMEMDVRKVLPLDPRSDL